MPQLFDSLMPKSCGSPALITHSTDNTAIKQEATRLGIELLMCSYIEHRANTDLINQNLNTRLQIQANFALFGPFATKAKRCLYFLHLI